jgi:hypothetical protein
MFGVLCVPGRRDEGVDTDLDNNLALQVSRLLVVTKLD